MPTGTGEEEGHSLFMCFIDLTKAYDSVDRTLLWTVLAIFGIPQRMFAVIRQFHDGMGACVWLDDGECSDMFDVEQGVRQGCVLAPLLLASWGILYADDAEIVSRSPEGLEKMMAVIVTACAAFGLTVSEAKTEIMCLQTKGGARVPFTVTAAGQVYKQTVEFVFLGGAISADWDLRRVEVTRRIQRAWACFWRYKMEIYDRPSVRLRLKVRMPKAEVLETLLYGMSLIHI